jgi:hypothetical protein
MYRNVVLTLLLVVAIVIAIELARPRRSPPPAADPAELAFAQARAVLERRIPELKLQGMNVRQSVEEIRRVTGVPMEVNWETLGALGDRPVDIELHDVALGNALNFVLCLDRYSLVFYPLPQADFDVVRGVVMIAGARPSNSGAHIPAGVMTLRSYDVRDLLTDSYWGYQPTGDPTTQGEQRTLEVANLVQGFAGMKNYQQLPGSHGRDEPNGLATITPFAGRLIVFQTVYGHMQVEKFLQRLRDAGRMSLE